MAWLQERFGDHLISGGTDFPYPARSPDLTLPDFFLWGFLKDNVFRQPLPRDLPELRDKITNIINSVSIQTCHNVTKNLQQRLHLCLQESGGYVQHIIS